MYEYYFFIKLIVSITNDEITTPYSMRHNNERYNNFKDIIYFVFLFYIIFLYILYNYEIIIEFLLYLIITLTMLVSFYLTHSSFF